MTIKNALLGGTDYANSDDINATNINDTRNAIIGQGTNVNPTNLPIGSVVAWLKSLTNTPAIASGWVECNGQTLSDATSPYNGQTIPNLNGSLGSGLKGYFLRGHTSSGVTETSQNLAHTHTYKAGANVSGSGSNSGDGSGTTGSSGGSEARPHNYSVIWIMRVK